MQRQTAVAGDVGGLAGPGRDRAQPRRDDQPLALRPLARGGVAAVQQGRQALQLGGGGGGVEAGQVHVTRGHALHRRCHRLQAGQQLAKAEVTEGVAAVEEVDVQGHVGRPGWGSGARRRVGATGR